MYESRRIKKLEYQYCGTIQNRYNSTQMRLCKHVSQHEFQQYLL